jgi:hypothetical protein
MINNYDVFNNHIIPLWGIQLKNSVMKVSIWFIANLFRGKPNLPEKEKVIPILDLCKNILHNQPYE